MDFELSVTIARPPTAVFAFLRDKHLHATGDGSPVLLLEKTTPGAVGVGTRYVERVRMLPAVHGTIRSIVTRFEPDRVLEEDFEGAGLRGHLAYTFLREGGGTRLVQCQSLELAPWLRPFQPWVRRAFARRLRDRLDGIAEVLDAAGRPATGRGLAGQVGRSLRGRGRRAT